MLESGEQREVVRWFREEYPDYAMCLRVSLSGLNFGSGQRAARMINYIRAQGIHPGESDLLIALPRGGYGSLVIEHKSQGSAHKASPEQLQYIERHNIAGNCAVVTRGIDAAKAAIKTYMES